MTKAPHLRTPDQLLDALGITSPEEIDVEAIAQYCGATIVYEPLKGCEARILGYGDRAVIAINRSSSRGRQRFSAGHELGHWMYDRGKASFSCDEASFTREWSEWTPEKRANRYAADLLLPVSMFAPMSQSKEMTFKSVRDLASKFETSLTATAIRLVEHGSFPAMLVCTVNGKRAWFVRGPSVPNTIWPTEIVGKGTVSYSLLRGAATSDQPEDVKASAWIERDDAAKYWVREDAAKIGADFILSLLWWEDEQQLLDLESNESNGETDSRFG